MFYIYIYTITYRRDNNSRREEELFKVIILWNFFIDIFKYERRFSFLSRELDRKSNTVHFKNNHCLLIEIIIFSETVNNIRIN